MMTRMLSAAAAASLAIAAPAFAGNRDGLDPEQTADRAAEAQRAQQDAREESDRRASARADAKHAGSGGDDRSSPRTVGEDPFNRSMDAGG